MVDARRSGGGITEEGLTFGHGAGIDERGQAAALGVCGVVAGVDLDLVAREVLQAGDDGRLLGRDGAHQALAWLHVFGGLKGVHRGHQCGGGRGEEGQGAVGHAHGATASGRPVRRREKKKR